MILRITFNGVPNINDEIQFHYDANFPSLPVFDFTRSNVFKTTRINPGEVTLGTDGITQAENYYDAFLLDYGSSFTVTQTDNVVEIEANNGSSFFDYVCDSGLVAFDLIESAGFIENAIHEIIFTPKVYTYPTIMNRDYLITEDDFFIITEDNKKIRM